MKLDENLVAVHAYLCADGYVVKNPETQKHKYYRMGLRNTNLILLEDFQKRFEGYFMIKPRIVVGQRCEIGSKEIYKKLTDNFGSFYSWEWKMPELNEELSKLWLRVFFDCEGWVTCRSHQNRMIGADCVNEVGIDQVMRALRILGITAKVKKRNTRNIFSIFIFGKENLIKFKEKIGFLHPSKKEKLETILKDFVIYEWDFPSKNEELSKFTRYLLKLKSKIKKSNGILRIISNREANLLRLQKELKKLFDLDSRVNKRRNGIGTVYFELNINKRVQVKYLIDNNLINDIEKEKWMTLQLKK
ncbi:MAG: hypothetical protein KKF50_03200 [Nanoarchaeota archaeon]|nr:hypothetical protein [Nanoarchaeota archaeon]